MVTASVRGRSWREGETRARRAGVTFRSELWELAAAFGLAVPGRATLQSADFVP